MEMIQLHPYDFCFTVEISIYCSWSVVIQTASHRKCNINDAMQGKAHNSKAKQIIQIRSTYVALIFLLNIYGRNGTPRFMGGRASLR